jgi:DNA polymerase-3 subunit delta'
VSWFESIIDQEQPIRLLKNILLNMTIPNALLFTGTDGIGKSTTALAFAMACNCGGGEKPCQQRIPAVVADHAGKSNQVTTQI